jgi:hypothetical protein
MVSILENMRLRGGYRVYQEWRPSHSPYSSLRKIFSPTNIRGDLELYQKMIVFTFLYNLENAKTIPYERITA